MPTSKTITNCLKITCLVFISLWAFQVDAQSIKSNYWVSFKDKQGTEHSIFDPTTYLSPRALQRRKRLHISIDSTDLPVSPFYLTQLQAKGTTIRHTSKWLNAATILATDSIAAVLKTFPFVSTVERVGRYHAPLAAKKNVRPELDSNYKRVTTYYGYGSLQIGMLNGHALHRLGYRGKDIYIGVQDGGFSNVDVNPFLDSLFLQGRMLPSKDFVDDDAYVFESATHGTSVLSVMASNLPYLFVGTAPDATYLCTKTEDVRSESLTEECNWVAALEYADSLGVDVVNSSLGYTHFSEEAMNYSYKDLNGVQSRASRAADIAVRKGVFVVNSAGNSGGGAWKFIGTPADSKEIFSIGAVSVNEQRARFSSFGPTADGRIKPNIAALGQGTIVAGNQYNVSSGNGTSLSSPVVAGMVASLKQAFPYQDNRSIRKAIEDSASQANTPDNVLGYGIPDFYKAYRLLKGQTSKSKELMDVYASEERLSFVFLEGFRQPAILSIQNMLGLPLKYIKVSPKLPFQQIAINYPLAKGVYYIVLEGAGFKKRSLFIK